MSSNGVKAATVETLTAEVRVLMVGSRQITLSVAKQLDWVDLEDLTLFGRVKLGADGTVSAIGRGRSGDLCLARIKKFLGHRVWIGLEELGGRKIGVCAGHVHRLDKTAWVAFAGVPLEVHQDAYEAYEGCDLPMHGRNPCDLASDEPPKCGHWDPRGCDEAITKAIELDREYVALHWAAAKAPLIVLAGLR